MSRCIKPNTDKLLQVECELPPLLLPWLIYQHSLTEKLKAKAEHARLQVLGQCWEPPNYWDKEVLQIECDEVVLHREILMWAGNDACWYARTIIPSVTYQADPALFNRLKTESLGELVFNQPKIKRIDLMHYPISKQSIEYYWLNQWIECDEQKRWVRLSTFALNGEFYFFLIEIMLPGILRYSN